jgi:hypothetical protein
MIPSRRDFRISQSHLYQTKAEPGLVTEVAQALRISQQGKSTLKISRTISTAARRTPWKTLELEVIVSKILIAIWQIESEPNSDCIPSLCLSHTVRGNTRQMLPLALSIAFVALTYWVLTRRRSKLLPPGPPRELLIGNARHLKILYPWLYFSELAEKYGMLQNAGIRRRVT